MSYTINLPECGLYKKSEVITIPAGATVGDEFTVIKGRGDIKAISLTVGEGVLSDLQQVTFTLDNSGQSFIENDNLVRWSQYYRNNNIVVIPIIIRAGATINYTFRNPSGNPVTVSIEQYFYNPNNPTLLPE
jgi:hypothetical protein